MGGISLRLASIVVGVILHSCTGQQVGIFQANIPGGNVNNNNNNNGGNIGGGLFGGAYNRQVGVGGISFAIPGLSLLGGNNGVGGGGGGNIFGIGTVTVTRTVVSTVSTVTTASFRTCIAPTAALMPCAAGRRRRRDAEDLEELEMIEPTTPAMALIVGSTTIRNPEAVTEYLEAHKLSSKSVIYPPGVEGVASDKVKINPRLDTVNEDLGTTVLYPSQDTPEEAQDDDLRVKDLEQVTTETPVLVENDDVISTTIGSGSFVQDEDEVYHDEGEGQEDKARRGLGRTTTVTTVIRVTSVATSLATGTMATLTVSYAGCLPQSLPVSGLPCGA